MAGLPEPVPDDEATFHPCLATFLIFLAIGAISFIPGLYFFLFRNDWHGLVLMAGSVVSSVGIIAPYRISWNKEALSYRGLVTRRQVPWSEISKYRIAGPMPDDPYGPTVGLRVFTRASSKPVMVINIKPFSLRDIKRLTDKLDASIASHRRLE